jgi:hypothetical protein
MNVCYYSTRQESGVFRLVKIAPDVWLALVCLVGHLAAATPSFLGNKLQVIGDTVEKSNYQNVRVYTL